MEQYAHWLLQYIDDILTEKTPPIILNSGKTTSGTIHIGILRELMINDGLLRLLSAKGVEAKFLLFIDDYDTAKHFPEYIPNQFNKYVGYPFCDVPDPFGCHESYAKHFATEFTDKLPEFFLNPEIIFTSQIYLKKPMKDAVRIALDKVEIIRGIYRKYIVPTLDPSQQRDYMKKLESWYPAMVVCPKCGHLATGEDDGVHTNRVLSYDKRTDIITAMCHNCSTSIKETIEKSRMKLTWRVDWPAKWSVYKVSVEPAGKDHAVKGGAYDTGLEISKAVFGYEGPVKIAYEWLRFGDRDMKTHKGIVFTPEEYLRFGYPEAFRLMIMQTTPGKAISFRPEFFPQMVDEFIQKENLYYTETPIGQEPIPEDEVAKFLYPLCVKEPVSKTMPMRLPFRFALLITQLTPLLTELQIQEKCEETFKKVNKTSKLSKINIEEIHKTLELAKYWNTNYAPASEKIEIPSVVPKEVTASLTPEQKAFLKELADLLETTSYEDEQILQNQIFALSSEKHHLQPKKTFQAIYYALINKPYGPRLAPFLQVLDNKWVVKRLREAVE